LAGSRNHSRGNVAINSVVLRIKYLLCNYWFS